MLLQQKMQQQITHLSKPYSQLFDSRNSILHADDYCVLWKHCKLLCFLNIDIYFTMCFWRSMFWNTVNYRGSIRLFDYSSAYKFVNIDFTMCFWWSDAENHVFSNACGPRGGPRGGRHAARQTPPGESSVPIFWPLVEPFICFRNSY